MWGWRLLLLVGLWRTCFIVEGSVRPPRIDIGHSAGLIPDCPGVLKNATISPRMLRKLEVVLHRMKHGCITSKPMSILTVPKSLAKDKHIDLRNKKTVLYAVGYLDSSILPHSQAIAAAYSKRGYNVLVTETFRFFIYIYPKSVRLARAIGTKLGEMLVELTALGLTADNLELVGASLGAHVVSYAAKHFYKMTGTKPSSLTGLDPAGPCFRSLDPDNRFDVSDAERVLVLHTNIDGFGIAEPLGHVDIYANGGEYQPSDIPYIPCLVFCSHVRAIIYWWQTLEHPKKFIAVKCDSIQDARYANCFNNTADINYLGLETDFGKRGIYYLSTSNNFPYYIGMDGLKKENEVYTSVIRSINSDDRFVV